MTTFFRPFSVCRILLLTTWAVVLLLGSHSPPLYAGDVRYEGKEFWEWRNELQDELAPGRRVQAIHALTAFAAREQYRTRVCETILEAMHDYDVALVDAEDSPVVEAANRAFEKIGAAADASVLKELKEGPPLGRRYAISVVRRFLDKRFDRALRDAIDDKDSFVRANAVKALVELRAEPVVPILLKALEVEDGYPSYSTLERITELGPVAKDTVPGLVTALKKTSKYYEKPGHTKEDWIQTIMVALTNIGPDAKEAIPVLTEFAERDDIVGRQAKLALEKIAKKP